MGQQEIVAVFGGAGGLGSAITRMYSAHGLTVIVADLDRQNGEALARKHERILYEQVDTTRPESVAAFYGKVRERFGYLTHLVSLAGLAAVEEFEGLANLDADTVERSIRLNLTSHLFVVREGIGLLEACPDGNRTVTLVSSVNALKSFGLPAYSAAKAGLIGFMHAVAGELGRKNIRINCVSPGTVPTPATMKEPKDFEGYKKLALLNRLTTAEEVAKGVFAVTHLLTAMVGQNLVLDCGQTLSTSPIGE